MGGYQPLLMDFNSYMETVHELIEQSGAVAVISEKPEPGLRQDIHNLCVRDLMAASVSTEDWTPAWENELAFCTSGTTGTSKIFLYNAEAILANFYYYTHSPRVSPFFLTKNQKLLAFIPFYHILDFYLFSYYV